MPDRVIKNKSKRPVSSVKKQVSAPIRPTIKIFTKKKNTYTEEKSYICTMSQNSLASHKYNKVTGSIHPPTSSNPRSSQSELRKRFIDRSDKLSKKSYQTLFKELEEQHKDVTMELEESKRLAESLQHQLYKVKHDKEIQTCGISLDQLENDLEHLKTNLKRKEINLEQQEISLQNMTDEKNLLNLELGVKNEKLSSIAAEISTLNSKIEILSNTVDGLKKTDSEKTIRIENLFKERNKFKNDFIEVLRERDLFQEELIVLKNSYKETSQKLHELRSEVGKKRFEFVQRSMRLSEQSDLNIKQQKQIKLMEDITLELELMVKSLTLENQDYIITIDRLKEDVVELKNEIKQWETKAGCWINKYVREKFESKIEDLENENQRLNVKNLQLTDQYNKTISEKCEQISEKEKIVEMKQSKIEQMKEIINLMRKTNVHFSDDDQIQ
ncbi:tropomyosin-like isoform X2 [Myzus persicae]|nr:tropomyosin-like isoform X2 [Myzus persicae]XP_022181438.1 tropomyosin-like isoform X2 [Myzus persicae]